MGKWGDSWRQRARRVRPAVQRHNSEAGNAVVKGLRKAVQIQLYDRTGIPVSRRLYRSITLQTSGNAFIVGFDSGIAPHVRYRLNMTGRSKTDGHRLDMAPNAYLGANVYPRIGATLVSHNRRIIGTKRTVILR